MITEHDLRNVAETFVPDKMHPTEILNTWCCVLDAFHRDVPLWLAIHYNFGLEIGLDQGDCENNVAGIKSDKDIVSLMHDELSEYCKHSWKYKLEQLAALNFKG